VAGGRKSLHLDTGLLLEETEGYAVG
jgi:hypothetical protein